MPRQRGRKGRSAPKGKRRVHRAPKKEGWLSLFSERYYTS
jgi:hypothetical protein